MSRTALITAEFAGEQRDFRLAWGELMELQERRDAGPSWILTRLISNQWMLQDIPEVIRLGLIGAGMDTAQARKLVTTYVENRPMDIGGTDGLLILAVKILSAALHGSIDEPVGKILGEARPNGSMTSPEEKFVSALSSAMQS